MVSGGPPLSAVISVGQAPVTFALNHDFLADGRQDYMSGCLVSLDNFLHSGGHYFKNWAGSTAPILPKARHDLWQFLNTGAKPARIAAISSSQARACPSHGPDRPWWSERR